MKRITKKLILMTSFLSLVLFSTNKMGSTPTRFKKHENPRLPKLHSSVADGSLTPSRLNPGDTIATFTLKFLNQTDGCSLKVSIPSQIVVKSGNIEENLSIAKEGEKRQFQFHLIVPYEPLDEIVFYLSCTTNEGSNDAIYAFGAGSQKTRAKQKLITGARKTGQAQEELIIFDAKE